MEICPFEMAIKRTCLDNRDIDKSIKEAMRLVVDPLIGSC